MISYIKNIKNPALKCFLQIFPLFVLFFIWKDFGDVISDYISNFFVSLSSFMIPVFRKVGEYVLAVLLFVVVWIHFVYRKLIETEKDITVLKFWQTLGHVMSIPLLLYAVLYSIDLYKCLGTTDLYQNKTTSDMSGLFIISGAIAVVALFSNIFLFSKMEKFKKDPSNR